MAAELPVGHGGQGRGTPMSQITFALRRVPRSEPFMRWQATIVVAFASGSLTSALANLGAALLLALARKVLAQAMPAPVRTAHHA